jgi:molybdate transport system substrate-binding protein
VEAYARGRLVLVWRDGTRPPTSLEALGDARYQAVAIANPEHAPYGAAAREALGRLGIRHAVESRIVLGENVAQAYQFVETGNADVGLVALSVALADGAPHLPVPDSLHDPILQAAGVLERSTHPDARAFLDFVLGAEGQAMLAQHGLGPRPR